MTVQSKTMKDSISEGGNNTENENELARLNQLNNQLLAKVAALNKEKLTWSSVSGNYTSASMLWRCRSHQLRGGWFIPS